MRVSSQKFEQSKFWKSPSLNASFSTLLGNSKTCYRPISSKFWPLCRHIFSFPRFSRRPRIFTWPTNLTVSWCSLAATTWPSSGLVLLIKTECGRFTTTTKNQNCSMTASLTWLDTWLRVYVCPQWLFSRVSHTTTPQLTRRKHTFNSTTMTGFIFSHMLKSWNREWTVCKNAISERAGATNRTA